MNSLQNKVRNLMQAAPVIPVLVVEDVETAVPMARALCKGGLKVLEITLRSDAALEAIRVMAREVPDAMVGAGTVNSVSQMKTIAEAGATFAVSPGFTPALSDAANAHNMPWLPGVSTAGDILNAMEHGRHELKFFPAAQSGGPGFLKALQGPFQEIVFCPTGGINAASANDYLSLDNVLCVGGSWVAPKQAVAAGDWDKIEALAQEAVSLT